MIIVCVHAVTDDKCVSHMPIIRRSHIVW